MSEVVEPSDAYKDGSYSPEKSGYSLDPDPGEGCRVGPTSRGGQAALSSISRVERVLVVGLGSAEVAGLVGGVAEAELFAGLG